MEKLPCANTVPLLTVLFIVIATWTINQFHDLIWIYLNFL